MTSGARQGSVLCLVLMNIFMNGWEDGTARTLGRYADDTKLWMGEPILFWIPNDRNIVEIHEIEIQ